MRHLPVTLLFRALQASHAVEVFCWRSSFRPVTGAVNLASGMSGGKVGVLNIVGLDCLFSDKSVLCQKAFGAICKAPLG